MSAQARIAASQFERVIQREQSGWSEQRKAAAERLRLSLRSMDQGAYAQSIAMQRGAMEDLRAFEELERDGG